MVTRLAGGRGAVGLLLSLNESYECRSSPRMIPFHSGSGPARRCRAPSPVLAVRGRCSFPTCISAELSAGAPRSPGRFVFPPTLPHCPPFYRVLRGPLFLDFTSFLSAVYFLPSWSFHAIHTSLQSCTWGFISDFWRQRKVLGISNLPSSLHPPSTPPPEAFL